MCEQLKPEIINNILILITMASETMRDYNDDKKNDLVEILNLVLLNLTTGDSILE
jgi:hypothetical protein